MPIGQDQADDDRGEADQADADADALEAAGKVGVQPLALAPGGVAHRAAALVDLPRNPVEPGDRPFDLVGLVAHLASIGVSGEAGALELALVHPFGAGDVALRLLDFLASVSTVCFMLPSA